MEQQKTVTITQTDISKPKTRATKKINKHNKDISYKKLKHDLIKRLAKYRQDVSNENNKIHGSSSIPTAYDDDSFVSTMESLNKIENTYQDTQKPKVPIIDNIDFDTLVKRIDKEPVYGCLKNGKKKTLKQLRRNSQPIDKLSIGDSPQLHNNVAFTPENSSVTIDVIDSKLKNRQNHISQLKEQRKQEITSITPVTGGSNSIDKKQSKNRKIKRIKKTCKVGKYDGKVVVLLPNKKTRKKIHDEISEINCIPVYKIKDFLRSKKLISAGCNAPDEVLRETMKNTILSGELEKQIIPKESDLYDELYHTMENEK